MLKLSNRETEIAGYLALGETEKEIAGKLYISVDTVHTHKKSIFRKLGARSVIDVTRIVFEYVTKVNMVEVIRKEIIEPSTWKVCSMLLFISLNIVAMMHDAEFRQIRVKTTIVSRNNKTRKKD